MVLKLAEAKGIVDGAIAKARELNVEISVVVCNAEGRLITLSRMDGVSVAAATYHAMGKANASVAEGVPSHEAKGTANRGPTYWITGEALPVLRRRGGLPILRDGILEGACGVCGADDESRDEECARAGLAALPS